MGWENRGAGARLSGAVGGGPCLVMTLARHRAGHFLCFISSDSSHHPDEVETVLPMRELRLREVKESDHRVSNRWSAGFGKGPF